MSVTNERFNRWIVAHRWLSSAVLSCLYAAAFFVVIAAGDVVRGKGGSELGILVIVTLVFGVIWFFLHATISYSARRKRMGADR